jgi:hypothetical protein
MNRYIIEGTWTGYSSTQMRIVHRTVHKLPGERRLIDWATKTHKIIYTDGTALILTVRPCKPKEKIHEINGYSRLIKDCALFDKTRVVDLPK